MIEQHLYATGIWAVSCILSAYWVIWALLRPRSPPKYPMNKTGFYKHSKNFER
jgi:hypothetical protein